MAPAKAKKDDNTDVYILPKTEQRDLIEKINADPNCTREAVLNAIQLLYILIALFTNYLI
jgi:hypothetical protein